MLVASGYAVFYSDSPRLWAFAIVYWVIAGVFFYCYSRVQPFDLFSPVIGLVVLLFLYSFASGLYVEQLGVMFFGEQANDWVIGLYYISCLAGLTGLAVGALLGSHEGRSPGAILRARAAAYTAALDPVLLRRLLFWSAALGILLAGVIIPQFNFLHVTSYHDRAFSLRLERSASAGSGLREVFLSQLPVTYILCASTLLMLKARRRWAKVSGLPVLLSYLIANTLAGWRGVVVGALLIPVIYYHYRVKPLSMRFAIVAGLLLYLFVNALSIARYTSNPVEMAGVLRENIGANGLAFIQLSSSGELAVGHNLMRLISGIESGETRLTYGSSIVGDLLVFIPRALFPNRPLPLIEKFVDVFYPGVLETGGGYGLFILQDGYWAFGIPGVFLFMVAYGWGVQRLYRAFMLRVTSDLSVLCYSTVYAAIVLAAVRNGTFGGLKLALINAMIFLVLSLLLKAGLPGRRSQRSPISPGLVESSSVPV